MTFPTKLYCGDTWKFSFLAEVNPLASLVLHLNSTIFQLATLPATSDIGLYEFTISTAVSNTAVPGTYSIAIISTEGATRTTLDAGSIVEVLPNPTTSVQISFAARMVAALEALLEGRVTGQEAVYSAMQWKGRSITKLSPSEIHQALTIYKKELDDELQATAFAKGQGGRKNKIKIWFR